MENTTQSSPFIILLAFAIYGVVHSLMASLPAKDLVYTFLGKSGERYYRLFYNIFSFVTLLPVLALPFTIPDQVLYTIPENWKPATQAIQIISMALLFISVIQTGMFSFIGLSQALGNKSKETLTTKGLYGIIRHPIYTFSIIFLWLTPTMTQNTALLCLAFSLYFIIGGIVEERKLVKIFGDEYQEYAEKTSMFIPFL
jgi:protein-S-isoprenylcysteine O-methyltransferase Ste14